MTVLPMLAVGIFMNFVAVLFVLTSIVLVLVILVQKGRGGGLSGAFGGGMAGGLLGSKTGDFLTWVTIVLVAVFLTLAILMARFYRPRVGEYGASAPVESRQPAGQPAPTQPETPAAEPQPSQPETPAAEPQPALPDTNSTGG